MVRILKYSQTKDCVEFDIEYTDEFGYSKISHITATTALKGLLHYKSCIKELMLMYVSNIVKICSDNSIKVNNNTMNLIKSFVENRDLSLMHCIETKLDSVMDCYNGPAEIKKILLGKIRSYKDCYSKMNKAIEHQKTLK